MSEPVNLSKINLVALAQELGVVLKGNERVEISAPESRPTDGYVYIKRPLGREFFTLKHDGSLFHKRCQMRFRKVRYGPLRRSMTVDRTYLTSLSSDKAKIVQAALGGRVDSEFAKKHAAEIKATRHKLFKPSQKHVKAMTALLDAKAREGKPIDHHAVIAEFARMHRGEISPNFAEACFDAAMVKTMKKIHDDLRGSWAARASDSEMQDYVVGHTFAKYPFKEKVMVMMGGELKPGWDNSAREKLYDLYEQI